MACYIVHAARRATAITHLSVIRKLASDASANITVFQGGKKLAADWGTHESTYHSIWLRHNCQCSQCVTSSGQKATASTDLDPNVTVAEASIAENGRDVRVTWSCGHEGKLHTNWLKDHCYSSTSLRSAAERGLPASMTTHTQRSLPSLDAAEVEDDHGVWRWLKNLNEHGVCLLRGVSTEKEAFLKVAGKISHIQKTIYNEVFEVAAVEDPINIAYSEVQLEPHMDLEYYQSPPGLQLLHCVRNDDCVAGGESTMVDGLAVLENLRHTHTHHFSTLSSVPATFQKIHYERDDPVHMIYRRPHILLNGNGQEDVLPYYEAYSCLAKMINDPQFMIQHRFEVGDMLSFNNQRMLHGRLDFRLNGGVRLLRGLYVNIDEFKSRFQVLCSSYDPSYHAKHVFNGDHGF